MSFGHSSIKDIVSLKGSNLLVDSTNLLAISSVGFVSNVPETVEFIEVRSLSRGNKFLLFEILVEPVSTLDLHGVWNSVVVMMTSIGADKAESSKGKKFVHSYINLFIPC